MHRLSVWMHTPVRVPEGGDQTECGSFAGLRNQRLEKRLFEMVGIYGSATKGRKLQSVGYAEVCEVLLTQTLSKTTALINSETL